MIEQAKILTTKTGNQIVVPHMPGLRVTAYLPDEVVDETVVNVPDGGYNKLVELAATKSIDITKGMKVDTLSEEE